MQNPEIDLRALSMDQTESAGGNNPHDGPAEAKLEPWIEEYAASGAVKTPVLA